MTPENQKFINSPEMQATLKKMQQMSRELQASLTQMLAEVQQEIAEGKLLGKE